MSAIGILLLELAGLFTLYLGFFLISSVYMNFFRKIFKASDILQTKYSWWFFFLLSHVITYIGFCGAAYSLTRFEVDYVKGIFWLQFIAIIIQYYHIRYKNSSLQEYMANLDEKK